MNNFYQPRPKIAHGNSFDSGVDSFHLIWSLGKEPCLGMQTKPIKLGPIKFERDPILFQKPVDAELDLQLLYLNDYDGNGPTVWIRGRNNPDVLFMARIEIRNDGNPRFKTLCFPPTVVSDFSENIETPASYLSEDYSKTIKGSGKFVVHCWIDIPKKMDASRKRSRSFSSIQGGPHYGPGLLSSDIAGLWKEVIGKREESTPALSDVLLVVKNDKEEERGFNCHRVVLASRSPVFAQLLVNCNVVKNRFTIELDGADIDIIEYVLEYIYTGFARREYGAWIRTEWIERIAEAAEKFSLPELKDECSHEMIPSNIESIDEWFKLLRSAEKLKMEHLKRICLVALSSDPRLFDDPKMRDQISAESMVEVMEMREENTKVIEMEMDDEEYLGR